MPHRFRMGRTSRAKKDRSGKKDEPLYEVSQITGLKYINGKVSNHFRFEFNFDVIDLNVLLQKHFHVMWKRTGAKLCKKTSRSFEPVENVSLLFLILVN